MYISTPENACILVGCSQEKTSDQIRIPAAQRYDSGYWTVKRQFAEAVAGHSCYPADRWTILSGKYGLLHPGLRIDQYDQTIDDLASRKLQPEYRRGTLPNGQPITTLLDYWAAGVATDLQRWLEYLTADDTHNDCTHLLVLLGSRYLTPLRDRSIFTAAVNAATQTAPQISYIFQQIGAGGIGEQMQYLKSKTQEIKPGNITLPLTITPTSKDRVSWYRKRSTVAPDKAIGAGEQEELTDYR